MTREQKDWAKNNIVAPLVVATIVSIFGATAQFKLYGWRLDTLEVHAKLIDTRIDGQDTKIADNQKQLAEDLSRIREGVARIEGYLQRQQHTDMR